ncbi:polysaccharide export outer membrane protein [Novosphingobium sp. PhB165]|uniref:polysaccharide biosynthesis/export family protein n=1 Tax=Novosphingobium sp. PhB165 TaxID=2485105 RepID=UPI0010461D03|nr:polysaccharide biosynthesis/export family protein [Novosphingobium sp. PhB165]TCM18685.1 polysaccharide export outer membrane protein [Novosphingobium sp. PhB165]
MKKVYTVSARLMASAACVISLSACAVVPASGPSTRSVDGAPDRSVAGSGIQVIDVTDVVAHDILASSEQGSFSESLGEGRPIGSVIGKGDVLDIAIWEAPPAALFGVAGGGAQLASQSSSQASSSGTIAHGTSLPEQMVDSDGQITVPFVGRVQADGRTPQQIAKDITGRLVGKAHQPQAIVRLIRNATANVTVVGDVANSARIPLTARGERILDVLASVGGVKQPVGKMTVQITRDSKIASLPLETVIRDPRQNVRLQPDDIMTVMFQPFSFTALGAVGRNEEVPFEATGLTLAQAMGRVAGLQDARADVKGVFIFRLEDPAALSPEVRATAKVTPDGKVPVIYRINMKDPSTFFIAQSFPIRNKDVLYVSNAPLADFQKFLNAVFSTVLPVATTAAILAQ